MPASPSGKCHDFLTHAPDDASRRLCVSLLLALADTRRFVAGSSSKSVLQLPEIGQIASAARTRQETPDVMDLLSAEFPGPPIPNGRVAEPVRLFDHGFVGDDVPFPFNSHFVPIANRVPFILRRVSVGGCATAMARFVLQSLHPFAYRGIHIAVLT